MTQLNDTVIAEFRENGGAVRAAMDGHFKDVHLVLLHHLGRRSGRAYVTPLLYVEHGDSWLLAGSNGGAEPEPQWVANVEAMRTVTLEFGEKVVEARPAVLRGGAERDRLYRALVEYWPDLLNYEKNTDRSFPVIQLVAINADSSHDGESGAK